MDIILFYRTYKGVWYATALSVVSMGLRYGGISFLVNEEILTGIILLALGIGGAVLADYLGKR